MKNFEIAHIKLGMEYHFDDFFHDKIFEYQIADNINVDYQIKVIISDIFPAINGDETIVFRTRRIYESASGSKLVVYSETGNQIKQMISTSVNLRKITIQLSPEYGKRLPEIEYLATGMAFFGIAINEGCVPIHASAISYNGQAIIFSAPSQTGKSTHASLWKKYLDDVDIINDDKPIIRINDSGAVVYGTPWSGKTAQNVNRCVPLKAIVFLHQAVQNHWNYLSKPQKLTHLFRNVYRPRQEDAIDSLITVLEQLIDKIPMYEIHTDISKSAFDMIYHVIYPEDEQ
ncbi:MAG: hypothetical protein WC479_03235 [Candidatus Izemoplasmatales bacterium]|jgi:hypothetical protein|nr:hypothetical protein [Candidatus Izemoplasmatales bacterium]MDD3865936.1 hypothetical protein [Candidatus Izemoplasmatales bacterium]